MSDNLVCLLCGGPLRVFTWRGEPDSIECQNPDCQGVWNTDGSRA